MIQKDGQLFENELSQAIVAFGTVTNAYTTGPGITDATVVNSGNVIGP